MKRARELVILAGCCLLFTACGAHTGSSTSRNSDLTVLVDTLENAHPNLHFNESAASFDGKVKIANAMLPAHATPAAAFDTLAPLAAGIGDAHTWLDPYTTDYRTFRDGKGKLFPLELRFQSSKATVIANYEKDLNVPNGARIVSIAGEPIPRFLGRLERFTSGERSTLKAWRTSEDLRALMWLDGFRAPFPIRVEMPDGRIVNKSAKGCTIDDIHAWDKSSAGYQQLVDYDFRVDRFTHIGVLTIHTFDRDNARDWDTFLQHTMRTLARSNVRALVIDVRENDGGDTALSDDLLKRFARQPFRDFTEVDIKVSKVVKDALGHDRYVDIYGDDAWNSTDGQVLREAVDYEEPLPAARRFSGKVYVLIGPGTYSTAAIFADSAKASRSATILGQPSGGLATLYGEAFSFTLPESKIDATVSTKFLVAADGNRVLHTVQPDKMFTETPPSVHDAEMANVLRFVARMVPMSYLTGRGAAEAWTASSGL